MKIIYKKIHPHLVAMIGQCKGGSVATFCALGWGGRGTEQM